MTQHNIHTSKFEKKFFIIIILYNNLNALEKSTAKSLCVQRLILPIILTRLITIVLKFPLKFYNQVRCGVIYIPSTWSVLRSGVLI